MKLKQVFIRLYPKQDFFFPLLRESADKITVAAYLLDKAYNESNVQHRKGYLKSIAEILPAGKQTKGNIHRALISTYITPFNREDIYDLADSIYAVLEQIERTASFILKYRFDDLRVEIAALFNLGLCGAKEIQFLIDKFSQNQLGGGISQNLITISNIEKMAYDIFQDGIEEVYDSHSEPMQVIKANEVLKMSLEIISKQRRTANIFEKMMLKSF